jgi:hypothetical protein
MANYKVIDADGHVRESVAGMRKLSEAVAVESRPAGRPFAEQRLRDPEGNALDLSQTKGWQVDIDRWVRVA